VLLIAGVGYQYLGDLSFGPKLVERLQGMTLAGGGQGRGLRLRATRHPRLVRGEPGEDLRPRHPRRGRRARAGAGTPDHL
jgi:hypothetical protein